MAMAVPWMTFLYSVLLVLKRGTLTSTQQLEGQDANASLLVRLFWQNETM
jgi:hypothetical protein